MKITTGGAYWIAQIAFSMRKKNNINEKVCSTDSCAAALSTQLHRDTELRTGRQMDGVHSPDCEELDPNKRKVRRKPKQHRAVVGFIVVLGKYLL